MFELKKTCTTNEKEQLRHLWNKEYPRSLHLEDAKAFDAYLESIAVCANDIYLQEGKILGWLLTFERDQSLWFPMILDRSIQGKGIGRKLLEKIQKRHPEINGWAISKNNYPKQDGSLYRSPIGFYQKVGFSLLENTLETKAIQAVQIQYKRAFLFTTKCLRIQTLQSKDFAQFKTLLSDPAIVSAIPQEPMEEPLIKERFEKHLQKVPYPLHKETVVWGVYEKDQTELIGLVALLTNNNKERELGYRFRSPYWGKGYATELSQGFLHYFFDSFPVDTITADVWEENKASKHVIEKFFQYRERFYNATDQCWDLRYALTRQDWIKHHYSL